MVWLLTLLLAVLVRVALGQLLLVKTERVIVVIAIYCSVRVKLRITLFLYIRCDSLISRTGLFKRFTSWGKVDIFGFRLDLLLI